MAKKLKRDDGAGKVIGVDKLRNLLARAKRAQSQQAEVRGSFGSAIKSAVENDNLHAAAFAQIVRLSRMDAVKLRAFLDNFDYYRDVLELDNAKAGDLFKDAAADDGEELSEADDEELSDAEKRAKSKAEDKAEQDAKNLKKAANGGIKKKVDPTPREKVTSGTPITRAEAEALAKAEA